MSEFRRAYQALNDKQRQAVDSIDGPLLVIAGPGTGKTQLLSARVAHILDTTDTLAQNIICLTFTESGAENMRQRLSQFIGASAYDVSISTYHAFGGDILSRFSHLLPEEPLTQPLDTLKKHQIVSAIVEQLSYADALKQTKYHIKDLIATISEIKRALLTPDDLRAIAVENTGWMDVADVAVQKIFGQTALPRTYAKAAPLYQQLFNELQELEPTQPVNETYGSLGRSARLSLELALIDAETANSTSPLTKWKNAWLAKNTDNYLVWGSRLQNQRLASLADVMQTYEATLQAGGWYDFDDMILKAIRLLETHDDLRFTLQEQYQYIMLDEYQDTNAAQAKLVALLADNPVNEGRPNIMAVGDDDQAIYAFQGAQYSNMLDFFKSYRDTKVINLSENYRSHGHIISTAQAIATQMSERLFHQFPGTNKELNAANSRLPNATIERRDFASQIGEFAWVAEQIDKLIAGGTHPDEIAVLTPKHKTLEALVPYLQSREIPMRYEKRENILENPPIQHLLTMMRLVLAIGHDERYANSLWPAMLSMPYFELPITLIWQISWQVADAERTDTPLNWTKALLTHEDQRLRQIGLLMAAISQRASTEPCERVLDYLTGTTSIAVNEPDLPELTSPLRNYYMEQSDTDMVDIVSDLTVLRSKLRDYQKTTDGSLLLVDLVALVDAYEAAGELMLNTSPYNQAASAVQLMTVYKAKGLEFQHVFLLSMTDEEWGGSGRSNSNKLTLPANLAPIRHSGATEDERLRLLFVAITRAKYALYLTSYTATYSGKNTKRLKYLDERQQPDGGFAAHVLPSNFQQISGDDTMPPDLQAFSAHWHDSHVRTDDASLHDLLAPRLQRYQLSPTHLNAFCDLIYAGPQSFFINTILRFPSAPGIDGEFGNAIHETLEWIQKRVNATSHTPKTADIMQQFQQQLTAKNLPQDETERLLERGERALSAFMAQRGDMFTPTDRAETNFKHENVMIGEARMAGKIDRLEIDTKAKTIIVVDYKTGRPHARWVNSDAKLHKYRQQLYCYKLLVEGSRSFRGYAVTAGRLEFVEPDDSATCHALTLEFGEDQLERTRQLIQSMWKMVMALDLPDTSTFEPTIKGIRAFEDSMLDKSE